jgi:hypothetical protein
MVAIEKRPQLSIGKGPFTFGTKSDEARRGSEGRIRRESISGAFALLP